MNYNASKLHRKIAPILFLPLLVSGLTGAAYRIAQRKFGLSEEMGDLMLRIHDGRVLSDRLAPLYVLLLGMGLVGLVVTGMTLFVQRTQRKSNGDKPTKLNFRLVHKVLAPIFFAPLFVTATTGIIYRVGKAWLRLDGKYAKIFLKIHEGNYIGQKFHLAYVSLVGLGLILLLITGIQMTGILRNFSRSSTSE